MPLVGLAVEKAGEIATLHGGYVAIIIRNDHCLLGCLAEKAETIASAAAKFARNVVVLNVTIASHTPLLDSAVEPFRKAVQLHDCRPFKSPVLAGVNAARSKPKRTWFSGFRNRFTGRFVWDLISSRLAESNCQGCP